MNKHKRAKIKAYEVISKFRDLRKTLAQRRVVLDGGKKWADPFVEVFDTLVDTESARQDLFFERKARLDTQELHKKLMGLYAFWKDMIKYFGPDGHIDIDGGDFVDMAEKHGLILREEYDREKHGLIDTDEGTIIWMDNLEI